MKKIKRIAFLIVAAALCCLAVAGIGCADKGSNGGGAVNGTYYRYIDGEYSSKDYITIKDGKYTVAGKSDSGGTVEINGKDIVFYTDFLGEKVVFAVGTVENGVIKIRGVGKFEYYCKEGKVPEDKPGGDTEKPRGVVVTFDTNGGKCDVTSKEYEAGKPMTGLPTPTNKGYNFICWQDFLGVTYNETTPMPENPITLYAQWEKIVTKYSDEYVSFKPATEGRKHEDIFYAGEAFGSVDKFVYVEITSDDLGGMDKVGMPNNFTLRTMEGMEYSIKSGYSWNWYQGNWETPNGAQRFNLQYGSNLQFVAVTDGGGVNVRNYLVDIYVKHDYFISLYTDLLADEPYDRVRVIEDERFPSDTEVNEQEGFEFDKRVYYNGRTQEYEEFAYSTVIRNNWSLYQTFKPVTLKPELDGGTLDTDVVLTPYTRYETLPVPEKAGYDFIGWEFKEPEIDKCYADVKGYTGLNYYSTANNGYTLKAHWEEKRFYHYTDGDVLKTENTIPVVAYDNKYRRNITEIVYAVKGNECPAPTKAPYADYMFAGWQYFEYEDKSKDFGFYTDIYEPRAIFAKFDIPADGYTAIPLCNEKLFGAADTEYVAKLPTSGAYKLHITCSDSGATVTVKAYAGNKDKTYSVNTDIALQFASHGSVSYPAGGSVTITVKNSRGEPCAFTSYLEGATASSYAESLTAEQIYVYGEECVAEYVKPGYTCTGWFDGETELTKELSYTFTMPAENIAYTAKWTYYTLTTARNDSNAGTVTAKNEVKTTAGESVTITATTNSGYTFIGWYNGETELTKELSYTFDMPRENVTYIAKWQVNPEMENFIFTSTENTLDITGIKDKSVLEITVPDYVTSIAAGAFSGCGGLTSIALPFVGGSKKTSSDKYQYPFGYIFGTSGYTGGAATEQYYYGSSTSSATNTAYYIPASLKRVTIIGGNILYGAFYNCSGLTSVTIGGSVTSIGSVAFCSCSRLTSVTIGNSVTNIGSSAFYDCSSLESITVQSGNTVYYSSGNCLIETASKTLIAGCKNSVIPTDGSVTSIGNGAFRGCSSLTSIEIPNSVTSIGIMAFCECIGLTSIEIPNSVTSIGRDAFSGCGRLIIYCEVASKPSGWGGDWNYSNCPVVWDCRNNDKDANGNVYAVIDGIRYSFYDGNATVVRQSSSISGVVTIPTSVEYKGVAYGVTSIGSSAFYGCSGLTNIEIPNSITSIGSSAFYGCSSLTSITLPFVGETKDGTSNIHFGYIFGARSYSNNSSYVPSSLKSVIITGGSSIGWGAFSNCGSLTSIEILNGVTSIGSRAFADCSGLTSIEMPNSVTSIGSEAFEGCSGLTSVEIPNSVTSIGNYAFCDCTSLTSVTIGNSVTSIVDHAFVGCSNLTSITIPDSVTSIGSYAFFRCRSLTSITIPNSVTSIGGSAFESSSLGRITIPNSVTSIGSEAFRYCNYLTIYCEATSKPSGWDSRWNPDYRPVIWDCKNK